CMTITGWSWDFGYPGGTSTQQNPFHSFPGSGTYNVCLTLFGHNGNISCTDTYCFPVNVDCAPIRPNGGSPYKDGLPRDIQVYPNPVSTDVFIEFTNEALERVSVEVLSTAGQIIARIPVEDQAEPHYLLRWSPGEEGMAEGVYYLQIKIGDAVTYRKVIFSH
ncbi:MAG: T9SS type A sorting domain-containing protein, partial [Owenweeksia sp.]